MSMLTLPETIAQTLLLLPGVTSPRQQYRDCVIVSESVSMLICLHFHASYSIPTLSPFLFMPSLYALLFVIHRIFYLLVSTHFYTWLSWKRLIRHAYKDSSPFVLLLVSLTGEEEKGLRLFLLIVVMETIKHTCIPSFTSICTILSKLQE